MKKIIPIALLVLAKVLGAQSTIISYGSALDGSDGLFFADSSGNLLNDSLNGVVAIGFFSSTTGNFSLADWVADFTEIDSFNFDGVSGTSSGFQASSISTSVDYTSETPYIFFAVGIADWANISTPSVSSFGIFRDTSWAFVAPSSPTSSSTNLREVVNPDTVEVGSLVSNPNGFQINAAPIPEPSALHLFALGSLGLLLRRRR